MIEPETFNAWLEFIVPAWAWNSAEAILGALVFATCVSMRLHVRTFTGPRRLPRQIAQVGLVIQSVIALACVFDGLIIPQPRPFATLLLASVLAIHIGAIWQAIWPYSPD